MPETRPTCLKNFQTYTPVQKLKGKKKQVFEEYFTEGK